MPICSLNNDLAAQYADNRAAYTAAKAAFIQHILSLRNQECAVSGCQLPKCGPYRQMVGCILGRLLHVNIAGAKMVGYK